MNQRILEAQTLATALHGALESAPMQDWLRTRTGQMWLAGVRLDVEMADPEYMDEMTRRAERYDAMMQEVAPRCAA